MKHENTTENTTLIVTVAGSIILVCVAFYLYIQIESIIDASIPATPHWYQETLWYQEMKTEPPAANDPRLLAFYFEVMGICGMYHYGLTTKDPNHPLAPFGEYTVRLWDYIHTPPIRAALDDPKVIAVTAKYSKAGEDAIRRNPLGKHYCRSEPGLNSDIKSIFYPEVYGHNHRGFCEEDPYKLVRKGDQVFPTETLEDGESLTRGPADQIAAGGVEVYVVEVRFEEADYQDFWYFQDVETCERFWKNGDLSEQLLAAREQQKPGRAAEYVTWFRTTGKGWWLLEEGQTTCEQIPYAGAWLQDNDAMYEYPYYHGDWMSAEVKNKNGDWQEFYLYETLERCQESAHSRTK